MSDVENTASAMNVPVTVAKPPSTAGLAAPGPRKKRSMKKHVSVAAPVKMDGAKMSELAALKLKQMVSSRGHSPSSGSNPTTTHAC